MPDIEANVEEVAALTKYLLEQTDEYLANHNLPIPDTFMAVSNYHVMMVEFMAKRTEKAIPKHQMYRMADLTFRKAMRELRLPGSTASKEIGAQVLSDQDIPEGQSP